MTYDIFSYNGEADLLEIRLSILNDYVDQFIIVESPLTFSGKPKSFYYEKQKERFKKWEGKIKYFKLDPVIYQKKYMALANGSPNTQGAAHWKEEFCQKEAINDALTEIDDEDIVFIGDLDEIWQPGIGIPETIGKIKLRVYCYYLNNRSNEQFWGTLVGKYKHIKGKCLNHLRTQRNILTLNEHGWHFTSMGGYEEVKRKLSDSYTEESYWTPVVESHLEANITTNNDFLGRNFEYRQDESEWPQYLKDNREKYIHMLK